MQTSRIRLIAISGATLALVIASTASVAAHPGGQDDQRGFGRASEGRMEHGKSMQGRSQDGGRAMFDKRAEMGAALGGAMRAEMGGAMADAMRGFMRGDMADAMRGGMGGAMRGGFQDRMDQFVRTETTFEAEDGLVTKRVDHGTVDSASEAGLDYSLSTGETASVVTDEDTSVITVSEQTVEVGRRGFNRDRMVSEEIALTDIESGAEIAVWAESQEDGTFLAQRIVVHPAADADVEEMTDEAGATDAAIPDAEIGDDSAIAPVTDA
jgi:hypothetical protein